MGEQAPTAAARAVVFDTDILIWYFCGHERARRFAMAHGLRVVDALIAATVLETGLALATANSKHYRVIPQLHLIKFRP